MYIDSHCHLDASEFGNDPAALAAEAAASGVSWIVLPAVERTNFSTVAQLATNLPNCVYALGIHPLFVPQATENDLLILRDTVAAAMTDQRFVAIGEIGLDFFVPALKLAPMRETKLLPSLVMTGTPIHIACSEVVPPL